MYVGYCIDQMDVDRLKQKWQRPMKHYDVTMTKFNNFFISTCLMTNFMYRCQNWL